MTLLLQDVPETQQVTDAKKHGDTQQFLEEAHEQQRTAADDVLARSKQHKRIQAHTLEAPTHLTTSTQHVTTPPLLAHPPPEHTKHNNTVVVQVTVL